MKPVRWRADRTVAVSPDDREVWLFGGPGPVRLAGLGSGPLARAVDGRRTAADVVAAAVADGLAAHDADRLLGKWLAAGHLVTEPPEPEPARQVSVRGPAQFRSALVAAGLEVTDEAPLAVVVVDDLLQTPPTDGPMVAVQLRGPRALVSPVLSATSACPRCLVARLSARRRVELIAAARAGLNVPPPSPVLHPATTPLAAGVVTAIAGDPDAHATDLAVIDPVAAAVSHQRLVPVPGCARCDTGGPTVAATHLTGAVAEGERDHATADSGGGLRVVDPDQTWQRYSHLIGDVIGLISEVRPSGPVELRAFSAGPNVAANADLALLKSRLRSGAGGKGTTLAAARAGALAEALERDSLVARGAEPSRRARMSEVERAIHPNDIQLFSEAQLHRAAQLQALGIQDPAGTGFHRVPVPFDTQAEHDWSPVSDLATGEQWWLPSSLLWFSWPGVPPGHPLGCSNGAAAGNTVGEALLQGVLELVERDSVAMWWYARCRRPAIDLGAFDDPRVAAAVDMQRAIGADFWVLDLTADLGIPAAVAVAHGVGPRPDVPLMGYGAHLDPAVAVVRALTELAQMQSPVMSMDPATLEFPGEAERIWFDRVTVQAEPWLAPHGLVPPADVPRHASVHEAIEDVTARLQSQGLRLLWADCTRPDVGLPVVRTWVPGLRHFWRRLAPGRLYDVPVAMGWAQSGYGEDDVNPLAMIL